MNPLFQIEWLPPSAITPDQANPRRHSDRQIKQIAQSISSFGFNAPILIDKKGKIVAGHGRLKAALKLDLPEVPTLRLEHLTEAQARAFMLADNRLAEISSWDDQLLGETLRELSEAQLDFSIEATGFTIGEIDLRIEGLGDTFGRGGEEGNLAALHPTVKPVRLVADAIMDCSARGDIVLDPFLGSGTTVIAAERIGRLCYGIEIDPLYVDTTVRRWQAYSGEKAIHAVTGKPFDDLAQESEAHHG